MRINDEGLSLIKSFEGLSLDAYRDVVGVWTIGYGHTGSDVSEGMTISEAQAEKLLRKDIERFEQAVSRLARVALNSNQFSALVSLAFNIGDGALARSTLLSRLNAGDFDGAAKAFEMWNKGRINGKLRELRGLTRRRAAEKGLVLKPETPLAPQLEVTPITENTRLPPSTEASDRRESLGESRTVQGAAVAGTAGAGAAVAGAVEKSTENADELSGPLQRLTALIDGVPEWAYWVLAIVAVLGAAYAIYARIDDWRAHRR